MNRNSVIPNATQTEGEVLVSFKDDKGRLRNVTIIDKGIDAEYAKHHKELDDLAEEYSTKREEITKKRDAIDDKAFAKAEQVLAKEALAAREAAETDAARAGDASQREG